MNTFESTTDFSVKMRKPAHAILKKCFKDGYKVDLRVEAINDKGLDQRASIDSKVIFEKSNVTFAIQEKYRTHDKLRYRDFTQELYNAYGTIHQSEGEFFHLYAEFYFYGWVNENETDFLEWFIMDIPKYKNLVLQTGTLDQVPQAEQKQNSEFGKSLFYTIPLMFLAPTILWASDKLAKEFNTQNLLNEKNKNPLL